MTTEQRFKSLLNRYLNKVATGDEQDELMQLIDTGNYDELIKDGMDSTLQDETFHEDVRMERAQEILNSILAREEVKTIPLKPSHAWKWPAAAAVFILLSTVGIWLYNNTEPVREANQITTVPQESEIFSGQQFVKLADGSEIILNKGSQITRHAGFGGSDRVITLIGEAYFDLAHDPNKPFSIITGDVITTVKGTAFNIKTTLNGAEVSGVQITVTRGKVEVTNKDKVLAILIPDQQLSVNTETGKYNQINTNAKEFVSWKSSYIIFNDVSFEAAVAILEDRFDAKIIFENKRVKDCTVNASFVNGENLDHILTVITGVYNNTYEKQPNGTIKIIGNGCH